MFYQFSKNTALIIVDVQNDFCPGGALAVEGGDETIPLINKIKPAFELCILTQDWHPAQHKSFASQHEGKAPFETTDMPYGTQVLWPDHCIQNTNGAAFHKDLNISENDLILQKGTNPDIDSYSGFFENDGKSEPLFKNGKTLTQALKERNIKSLFFCGLAYDFCVGWHALDARKCSFEATILKDACRAIAMPLDENGNNTEKAMDAQLIQNNVTLTHTTQLK